MTPYHPRRRPLKRFVCAQVHPGCDRVFTGPTDQAVLDQVLAHAAADHDTPHPRWNRSSWPPTRSPPPPRTAA